MSAMGTYQFKWTKPAKEVFVTGTFDKWAKSIPLVKENGIFTKLVDLPLTDEDTLYKFIVDGNWAVDPDAETRNDESGIMNNVLKPQDITPSGQGGRSQHGSHPEPQNTSTFISGIAPGATTAALAGEVPTEASKEVPDSQTVGVNPLPATAGAGNPIDLRPGEQVPASSEFTSNTIGSNVKLDKESYEKSDAYPTASNSGDSTVGINPLPATAGTGNPIDLKPGEKLPASSEFTSNTIDSNVKLDKDSYEKSDAYPTDSKALDTTAGALGVAPLTAIGTTIIPESGGLSVGGSGEQRAKAAEDASNAAAAGPTISSAGAGTTTADLAGQVPIEPRGTAVVEDDTDKVASTSNGANPGLLSAGVGTTTAALAGEQPKEPRGVPQVVDDSQVDAQVTQPSEETAAGKADVVDEIKDKVPEKEGDSSSYGGILGVAAATGAAAIGSVTAAATSLLGGGTHQDTDDKPAEDVPETVKESIETAGVSPEAAAYPEAVEEKKALEAELLKDGPTIADEDTLPAIAAATGASTIGAAGVAESAGTLGSGTDVEAFKSDPVAAPGASTVATSSAPAPAVEAFKDDPVSPETSKLATASTAAGVGSAGTLGSGTNVEAFKNDPVAAPGASTVATSSAPAPAVEAFKDDPVSPETSKAPAASTTATSKAPAETAPLNPAGAKETAQTPEFDPSKAGASTIPVPAQDKRTREPSRDLSPRSKPAPASKNATSTAATGASSSQAARPDTSATNRSDFAGDGTTDKKAKRRSFFGRIKDKLKHHD